MTAFFNSMLLVPTVIAPLLPFISSWKTNNAGTSSSTQITVPTESAGTYNCVVDWGDSSTSTITTFNDAAWTHTYSVAGTYTVTITGTFTGFRFNNGGDRLKFLNISQWGSFKFGNANSYFRGCANLTITATDAPSLVGTTVLSSAFNGCTSIVTVPNINTWNTGNVTTMSSMFNGCTSFNQALSFGTSNVTTMSTMFNGCTSYNQPVNFDASALTGSGANSMFSGCTSFNQAVSLNAVNVTDFGFMFSGCTSFNQAPSLTTSSATVMSQMFNGCTSFNQVLSLDTSKVTNMSSMFNGCTSFNQVVSFDTGNVTTMSQMFLGATSFNQPLSFNTAKLRIITSMFNGATAFNQDISAWVIAELTTATTFLTNSGFSITNLNKVYDSVTGWPSQATIKTNVTISFGSAHYSGANAIAGRALLVTVDTWTITDGGTP